ncbi:MAG: Flp pilus assembly complex ATPase component TadA, partial [Erysipelothrix sp.]|nr:Flp pilus assembly complex ATPase component TadA [Erysipelothrix sp.]
DVDLSYSDSNSNRYRLNVYSQRGLPALTMRLLNYEIPTIDGMKLPPILKQLTNEPRGLVLVTGPTGSGKSTTLAAMINEINIHHSKHIITLEYPIEYLHSQKKSLINQREIHFDTKSFSAALL